MARGARGGGYPLRLHPQNLQERLMPCAQFEALERHRQAWHNQGIDSDKSTVNDDNDNDAEDAGDPQGEPALLKTRIRKTTVHMFKRVLLFSQGAAEALYNNQMITTLDTLPHYQGALPCYQEARRERTWTPNLQALRDSP
jgi:hypothetical protein